jgi:hypothetical protein
MRVKLTSMSVEITHRVPNSHAWYENHTRVVKPLVRTQSGFFGDQTLILVLKSHEACWNLTRACVNHTLEYHNHIHRCQNHTLHVEINLVRVEITVVSVIITFVLVKISLRLEITLSVYKSHSFVFKSHFAFRNYTRACEHHIMRVNITLCVQKLHSCMWTSHYVCIKITLCV